MIPELFIFGYLDYYKGKPIGNHQLYKVGSNFSADLICKQYKQASTRVFLSATVTGGSQTDNSPPDLGQREIITTNRSKYWVTSDFHSERTINISSWWHLNAQCPYSHNPNSCLAKILAIAISQDHKDPVIVAIITAVDQTSISQCL